MPLSLLIKVPNVTIQFTQFQSALFNKAFIYYRHLIGYFIYWLTLYYRPTDSENACII